MPHPTGVAVFHQPEIAIALRFLATSSAFLKQPTALTSACAKVRTAGRLNSRSTWSSNCLSRAARAGAVRQHSLLCGTMIRGAGHNSPLQ